MDHQIRATAANDSIRVFAIYAKDTVEEARKRHKLSPVTELLSDGLSPEDILKAVLDGMDVNIVEKRNVSFNCDCSRDKVIKSLLSLNPADLQEMIDENKPIEVYCDFCGERYTFENSDFTFLKNR